MKFNKKVLKNGMRIITVPMKDSETVTVMTLVETGSKYETKNINGLSHFLEHMCFKGTEKRPTAKHISYELDSIGSQSNAFTGNEYTGYWAKAHKRHVSRIIDIISDIYLNSTLPEGEMLKEKGVVLEEINMYEDLPQRKVWDYFDELLYGDQPAGWTILGLKENIKNLKREQLVEYRRKHYVASATVIIVAGKFNEKNIIKEIEKSFSEISKDNKHGKLKVIESQNAPKFKLHYKKTDQAHLVLGFRSFDLYDERNWTLAVLDTILGKGMSSRLHQKLREELGICYYAHSNRSALTDHGHFTVSAGVGNGRFEEAVTAILGELKKLKTELVSEDELKKAKDYRIGNFYLAMESSDAFADFYGFQEIYKQKILKPEDYVRKFQKVTAKDVKDLANELFVDKSLNLAVVGPISDDKMAARILHI